MQYLLAQGADPTLFDSVTLSSCLHYAALHGSAACIETLLRDETTFTDLAGELCTLREINIADSQGYHR